MTKSNDSIIFESRREIDNIMNMICEHVKQNPKEKNNKDLERLYELLDVMYMEW